MNVQQLALLAICLGSALATNYTPVIAVISHPYNATHEAIPGSYVKYLEMGGARSLRFPFNASDAYMDNVLANTDGMFFIGGGESLPASAKYAYSVISGLQDAGLPYAMWGTCNGFQWLTELMAGHEKPNDILGSGYDAEELNLALNFTGDAKVSRLFNPISDYYEGIDLIGLLTDNAVTLNLHTYGFDPKDVEDIPDYTVLSTNLDRNGREFVSSFEHATRPIYGTQFHPEKNPFEYGADSKTGVPVEPTIHTGLAVRHSFELARFFAGEAAKTGMNRWDPSSGLEIIYKDHAIIIENDYEEKYLFAI
ncbi:hypothetical protein TeGR_g4793 [Tetraparma gracilis]|uniref:folate gamma-glutamyl hydrolase n=1 Tax=Tetraparma gracilis TaxID=2962635 RepID=A0ABQ6NCB2_9STRA|nr:hypothetical protein TeGR_g4793 [Tetraparma gracilis]